MFIVFYIKKHTNLVLSFLVAGLNRLPRWFLTRFITCSLMCSEMHSAYNNNVYLLFIALYTLWISVSSTSIPLLSPLPPPFLLVAFMTQYLNQHYCDTKSQVLLFNSLHVRLRLWRDKYAMKQSSSLILRFTTWSTKHSLSYTAAKICCELLKGTQDNTRKCLGLYTLKALKDVRRMGLVWFLIYHTNQICGLYLSDSDSFLSSALSAQSRQVTCRLL